MCKHIQHSQEIHLVCAVSLKGDHSTEIAVSKMSTHTHMGDDPSPTTRLSPENVAVLSQHDLFSRKWRQQHHHPSLLQPCRIFYNLEYYIKSSQNRFIYFALPVSSHIIQQPLQRKTFTAPPPSDCLPL